MRLKSGHFYITKCGKLCFVLNKNTYRKGLFSVLILHSSKTTSFPLTKDYYDSPNKNGEFEMAEELNTTYTQNSLPGEKHEYNIIAEVDLTVKVLSSSQEDTNVCLTENCN